MVFPVIEEARNFIDTMRVMVPSIVTIRGRLLSSGNTLKEGALIINFAKNQPLIIVPTESRSSAFVRLFFSSPMGERG